MHVVPLIKVASENVNEEQTVRIPSTVDVCLLITPLIARL